MTEHNPITAYWLKHYVTKFCTLCGSSGVIDTRGVRTAAGISAGRLNYCICPNGQEMRGRDVNLVEYAATRLYTVLVVTPSGSFNLACSCAGQSGRVPHDPHCPAHPDYERGRPA